MMSNATTSAGHIIDAPQWLAHRFDAEHDAVHFYEISRERRAAAAFLTDNDLQITGAPVVVGLADAVAGVRGAGPLHFLLHSAYCCSTLLANAFDLPGVSCALKEPQILNDLVGWRQRGAAPDRVWQTLDAALTLIARPFDPGEPTIVKPSNIVNGLATAMMTLRPGARALLLHAPLDSFLTSIARKGMWGRLWVRELLSRQLVDGLVDLGFEPRDYLLHTDLQAAAVGWLAQHRLFAAIAARWPERVRTLDSETLVARPAEALAALSSFFGVAAPRRLIADTVDAVFTRDAKTGGAFASGQRSAERAAGEALHAEEIAKVSQWAEAVAKSAGVERNLPAPLLPR